jgi:uncharacterized protein (UPF0548 family)
VFLPKRASEQEINSFISSQHGSPFSYAEVGATRTQPPSGYIVDHNRKGLGQGIDRFEKAVAAIKNWKQFDLGWVSAVPNNTSIEVGSVVAIMAKHFGFWSLNACRIVYLINDEHPIKRFGFAYGTLSGHAETGEERFTIEWHPDSGEVWYDILAFSRPQNLFVKLGFPLARMLQKRFARDSMAGMSRLCGANYREGG